MKTVSDTQAFGGRQLVVEHDSQSCGCSMRAGVFLPPEVDAGAASVYYLSGLTCTEENFLTKAGAQRVAAELGLVVVAPDTSPRGDDVPDSAEEWDFGKGAGFYLNATQQPWARNYQMYDYVTRDLPALIQSEFDTDPSRQGVFGHSMGGHGAITIHLKNPEQFRSVSAFAPIVAPTQVPWGHKALGRYLGDDQALWQDYDSCSLVRRQPSQAHILVDQGGADTFLEEQLRPQLFQQACDEAGQQLTLRLREGYDHSYFFVASFMEDHLRHHAQALS
ncbi:MAG: S-formylglutathione hydrolase [Xanthomonadales bacterium]|nr:S-formylglutathione hydrolase [Xanthomonadales bacterium]